MLQLQVWSSSILADLVGIQDHSSQKKVLERLAVRNVTGLHAHENLLHMNGHFAFS